MAVSSAVILLLLVSLPLSLCSFIIFPIYIYPTATAWTALYSSIAGKPKLTFQVVINPASGPGSTTYPNSDWVAALTKLNTYPNVQLIGYVHVSWGTRAIADVRKDISVYVGWKSYTAANIAVNGIFFDEAPAAYSSSVFDYYVNVTSYARSLFPCGKITTNQGVVPDTRYYIGVDYVNAFENAYSAYSPAVLSSIVSQVGPLKTKSTVMIYNFNGTATTQTTLVQALASARIGGVYVTTTNGYSSFSSLWTQFVTAMAATPQ